MTNLLRALGKCSDLSIPVCTILAVVINTVSFNAAFFLITVYSTSLIMMSMTLVASIACVAQLARKCLFTPTFGWFRGIITVDSLVRIRSDRRSFWFVIRVH